MQLTKLASKYSAWLSGFEAGEEDCQLNQWGDPRASFGAWRSYMQKLDRWDRELDQSYPEYKAGYEKALIRNKGAGMIGDPGDREIYEEPHHPWGYNRSRIEPEHRQKLDKIEPIPSIEDRLKNR